MPPSGYELITNTLGVLAREKPESILDIGICDGKWGFLAREHLEIYEHQRYSKKDWRLKIHGIEIFPEYRTPVWDYVYDEIFIGNAIEIVPRLGPYDVIIITEVIEHIDKKEGLTLLHQLMDKARKGVVISFPDGRSPDALLQRSAEVGHLRSFEVGQSRSAIR